MRTLYKVTIQMILIPKEIPEGTILGPDTHKGEILSYKIWTKARRKSKILKDMQRKLKSEAGITRRYTFIEIKFLENL